MGTGAEVKPVATLEEVEALLKESGPMPEYTLEYYPWTGLYLSPAQVRVLKEAGCNIGEPKEWK
jgi:hypothetical protein